MVRDLHTATLFRKQMAEFNAEGKDTMVDGDAMKALEKGCDVKRGGC